MNLIGNDTTPVTELIPEIEKGTIDPISKKLSTWILTKTYGRDVRKSLSYFVEWISVLTDQSFTKVNYISNRQDLVEEKQDSLTENQNNFISDFNERMNAQISGNTDLNEVIDARFDNGGVQHLTLKERLNDNLSIDAGDIAE